MAFRSSDCEVPIKRGWDFLTMHLDAGGSNSFAPDGLWDNRFTSTKTDICLIWDEQLRALRRYELTLRQPLWLLASLKWLLNWRGCRQSSKRCDWILISAAPLTWLLKLNFKYSASWNHGERKGLMMAHIQTFHPDWLCRPSDPFFRRYYVTIFSSTF